MNKQSVYYVTIRGTYKTSTMNCREKAGFQKSLYKKISRLMIRLFTAKKIDKTETTELGRKYSKIQLSNRYLESKCHIVLIELEVHAHQFFL